MRIASVGHAVFAAILITMGIVGLVHGDFTPIWAPVPKHVPGRDVLVYGCALVSLASGAGLLWRRLAGASARVLLGSLLLWMLVFRVRDILHAPAAFDAWDGCAETAVIVAGAWVLLAWFTRTPAAITGDRGVRIARVLYGLAMIPFGLAHLLYLRDTARLVPAWLPAHVAWASVTGGAFLAAAAAVLVGVRARVAARLSAVQIGLFTVLVWVPHVAPGGANAFEWHEFGISAALTATAWVVADSYRAVP